MTADKIAMHATLPVKLNEDEVQTILEPFELLD